MSEKQKILWPYFLCAILTLLMFFLLWQSFNNKNSINQVKSGDYLKQYVNEELLDTYKPYDMKVQYSDGKKLDAKLVNATIEDGNVIGSLELELKTGEKITLDTYRTTVNLSKAEISEITLTELADYEPADRSIAGIKLKLKTVTSEELADGSVVTNKLANASITGGKIQEGVIETNHLGSAIVTEIKIADGAVTTNKILNGTIASVDLGDGIIDDTKVSDTANIAWTKISKAGSSLADLTTRNSSDVAITDSSNYFTATNVEDALAELSGYNSLLGSTYLKVDASNDPITGQLIIQPTTDIVPLVINGTTGASKHLLELNVSNGSPVSYFDNVGILNTIQDIGAIHVGDTKMYSIYDPSYSSLYSNVTFRPISENKDMVFRFMPSGTADSGVMEFYNSRHDIPSDIYSRVVFKSFDSSDGFWIWSHTNNALDYENTMAIKFLMGDQIPLIFTNTNPSLIAIGNNNSDATAKVDIKGHTNIVQLAIRGTSGQTANIQEWKNSSGGVMANVTSAGGAYFAGNVGIGTTTPSYKLDVSGNGRFTEDLSLFRGTFTASGMTNDQYQYDSSSGRIFTTRSTGANYPFTEVGNFVFQAYTARDIVLGSSNGPRMILDRNGNVGIGTISPSVTLHIVGKGTSNTGILLSDNANGPITIKAINSNTGNFAQTSMVFGEQSGPAYKAAAFTYYSSGFGQSGLKIPNTGMISSWTDSDALSLGTEGVNDPLIFFTGGTALSNERLRILGTGNIGIGTSSPTAKLHIAGSGDTDITVENTGSPSTIHLSSRALTYRELTADWGGIYSDSGTSGIFISNGSTTGAIKFAVNSHQTEAMRITSSGYLGLGTSTPQSQLQLTEYLQLAVISSAPISTDCDEATERGRMKVDNVNSLLYICMDSGWVSK